MTLQRVLTAAVMVPVVVAVVWLGPSWVVATVLGVVIALAQIELLRMGKGIGANAPVVWTLLCSLWLVFEQWAATTRQAYSLAGNLTLARGPEVASVPLEIVLAVFAIGAAALLLRGNAARELLPGLGLSACAMLAIALPLSFLMRIHAWGASGPRLLLFTLFVIWVGDSVAYFVGRSIGRMPMAPVLSPKKTWEGAAGNLLGSLLVVIPFARLVEVEVLHLVAIAALANVAGQVGDLVESAYKRAAGVKDSGAILPGHGGVLDRVDSLIFAAPAVWCYVWFVLM